MSARTQARLVPLGLMLLLLTCRSERAGADDCAVILDRIVALELAEQGYRDPELQRCEGLSLPPGARECIAKAASAEEISHVCLR